MRKILFLLLLTASQIVTAQKNTSLDSVQKLDEVIISTNQIFGSKYVAKNRTGSAYFISQKELQKMRYTDANRILRNVPGVNIYEEDGFGLRPNISLRGTSPERSSKISLMEDGVLIAPAPYSAPAAYYFPTIARMQSVEVLKGSSQVQFGPFTTGGAINMISTTIPESFSATVKARYGSFNSVQFHAKIGDSKKNFGYMIEYLNFNSNGFKDLLNDVNTGFDKNDVVVKFRLNLFPEAKTKQSLFAKFQYADEVSNETYLGLSENDFNNNPFRRYSSSANDKMTNDHLQLMLTHTVNFSKNIQLTTVGYHNDFYRNWYKLNNVVFEGNRLGIATVLEDTNTYSNHFAIMRGTLDSDNDALLLKANNRNYLSQGIQTKFDYHWYGKNTFHDLEIGARYHYDEEDRFQWIDGYSINSSGQLSLTSNGAPGSDANRISSARAFASYATYRLKSGKWTLTPGIRYENILLKRENFGTNDPNRTGNDLSTRENNVAVFIPGLGTNYQLNNNLSFFGGIHKGFSPPGNQEGQKPEESINYELGSRFNFSGLQGEVVGFYNDYSNLLGSDLAASGGTGSLDQFNAGEVTVNGLEILLNYDLLRKNNRFSLPISFGYTYTNTQFENSFGSDDDLWGVVTAGDEMPYIPKNQFNTSISLEHSKFQLNLNTRYTGEFRTVAGTGDIAENQRINSNFIVDFSGVYNLSKNLNVIGSIINLFDATYAVSRAPAGLRPGHPFGVYAGIQYQF